MVLHGNVSYDGDGLTISTRAMVTQQHVLKVHTDNIANFGVPGYQSKTPVVTSFVEFLGPNAVDKVTNTDSGRLRLSGGALDFALAGEGYFQKLTPQGGIEFSRDGRMKLDKDGYLLSVDNKNILSADGAKIRLPFIPANPDTQISVSSEGRITLSDERRTQTVDVGQIGVANPDGTAVSEINVKQRYVEDANVNLALEYTQLLPHRRQFEANRQLFLLQSDGLSRMIQELGRAQ